MDPFPHINENVLFGKGDVERVSNVSIKQMCATNRCIQLLIDNSFDITVIILLLCFDILSDQIIISSLFCHFLVFK